MYAWGSTLNGKLGIGNVTHISNSRPQKIQFTEEVKIVDGSCGGDFTVLLDCVFFVCLFSYLHAAEGKLWSFGINNNGQLGIGRFESDITHVTEPHRIFKKMPKVKAISCGGDHSLALTEEGKVYTWGWGEKGALVCLLLKFIFSYGRDMEISRTIGTPESYTLMRGLSKPRQVVMGTVYCSPKMAMSIPLVGANSANL